MKEEKEKQLNANFFKRLFTRKQKRKAIREMQKDIETARGKKSEKQLKSHYANLKKRNMETYKYFRDIRKKAKKARQKTKRLIRHGKI